MITDLNPAKEIMLARYAEAYTDFVAVKDSASEDFIFTSAYRRQARMAALHCGATDEEIKAIEAEVIQPLECRCVLPEMSCPACTPEPWDGETELEF